MTRRKPKRDSRGRFSRVAGAKVATKTATRAVGRKASAKVRQSYVKGSFEKNLEVGQGGAYKGAKVGAEFRTPAGRGALVKGIVGYHGKPDRRLDVTPTLDKPKRELTVRVRPNSARKMSAPSDVLNSDPAKLRPLETAPL
ncbi:hypothetical protein [Rhodococcus sp. EPR-157]|uniref:hypothetical protein n=1 Tax=Rhodococcus sp. EPR-157 TaxID=1813677 RepID=UPI0008387728|nr:hypothetical protein [Rhodococcus sp. EPR-157]